MILHRLKSAIDRIGRNELNENFDRIESNYKKVIDDSNEAKTTSAEAKEIAQGVDGKATEALSTANQANTKSDNAVNTATEKGNEAIDIANQANNTSDYVQRQLDTVILESGDANPEVIQARADFANLRARLDGEKAQFTTQLAQNNSKQLASGQNVVEVQNRKRLFGVLITDDGHRNDLTIFKPFFERLNVPCSTGIVKTYVEGQNTYCDLNEVKQLQDAGWEILNHTRDHVHMAELATIEEIEAQITENYFWLNSNGLVTKNVVYPYGSYDDRVKRVAKQHHNSSRCSKQLPYGYNVFPLSTHELRTNWIGSDVGESTVENGYASNTFEHYAAIIDEMVAHGEGIFMLSFHSWAWNDNDPLLPIFEQVINYAKSKGVEFTTYQGAIEKVGNVVETGIFDPVSPYIGEQEDYLALGYNGQIDSNRLIEKHYPLNHYVGTESMVDFEPRQRSVNRVTVGFASNLPVARAGKLITEIFSRLPQYYVFNVQKFEPINDNNVYVRFGRADGTWGSWLSVNTMSFGVNNTIDNLIEAYNQGITLTQILTTSATNAPEGKAGVLLTYKIHAAEHAWNWQQYRIYNSNQVYERRANTDGTWGDWVDVTQKTLKSANNVHNQSITAFKMGTTYTKVTSVNASEMPSNTAGILTTYRIEETEHAFNWQEFKAYNQNVKYMRSFDANGSPRAWVLLTEVAAS